LVFFESLTKLGYWSCREPVCQISRISTPCRSCCLERKKFPLQEPLRGFGGNSGTEPLCNHLSPFETLMSAQTEFGKVQFRSRSLTQGSNHLVFVCRRGQIKQKGYINSFEPLHKTVYQWYVGGQVLWVHLEDQTELSDHNKVADKILTLKTIYKTAFKLFAPTHKLSRIKNGFNRFKRK
ncbi:hypothetical protein B0H13DRAFT_1964180, partial [Mycena leptocephala]